MFKFLAFTALTYKGAGKLGSYMEVPASSFFFFFSSTSDLTTLIVAVLGSQV